MNNIIKRNSKDYIINCNMYGQGGYNVVPKDVDPYNAYTIAEVEAYLSEHPEMLLDSEVIDLNRLAAQERSKRDQLIASVLWRKERHQDEVLLSMDPTEPLQPILEYIQALRDVTKQQGFPESINWPEMVIKNSEDR